MSLLEHDIADIRNGNQLCGWRVFRESSGAMLFLDTSSSLARFLPDGTLSGLIHSEMKTKSPSQRGVKTGHNVYLPDAELKTTTFGEAPKGGILLQNISLLPMLTSEIF